VEVQVDYGAKVKVERLKHLFSLQLTLVEPSGERVPVILMLAAEHIQEHPNIRVEVRSSDGFDVAVQEAHLKSDRFWIVFRVAGDVVRWRKAWRA